MDPPEKEKHGYVVKLFVPSVSGETHDFESHERSENQVDLLLPHLPSELLLENILNRLSSADRIRFGATSKENLSLVATQHRRRYEFRPIDRLPWPATFPDFSNSLDLKLFDPLHHQGQPHYATYQILDPKQGSPSTCFIGRNLKKGWFFGLRGISLLLFSSFNKRIIKLPDLDFGSARTCSDLLSCQFTFSSDDPSSPECVYFFLTSSAKKIHISTLQQQQQQQQHEHQRWKNMLFDKEGMDVVSDVVYHEGCFYCITHDCQLSAFDVSGQSWCIITPSQFSDFLVYPRLWDSYMVVCEGKLNLAFVMYSLPDGDGSYNVKRDHFTLFEFSSSTRTWVEKTSLGNHAFFLGRHNSFGVPVSSCDKDISDRMYFYCDSMEQIFYYSFKDGRCHTPKDGDYWSSYVEDGIWIEPPSPSELAS